MISFYIKVSEISFGPNPIIRIMKSPFLYGLLLLLLCGCSKAETLLEFKKEKDPNAFTQYIIKSGQHATDKNVYKAIELDTLQFVVRFDSTAIYKTVMAENQYDINKLYGFSDNGADHHQYSARFGWAWHDGALHLYAYVYNGGKRENKHLGTVPIGAEIACSIVVSPSEYIFSFGDVTERLPRTSTTAKAKGYQLYPYFGGDEVAPHTINVWIRNL